MKWLKVVALILLSAGSVFGQTSARKDDVVVNPTAGVPNPTIRVCPNTATGSPCTPTANIFSDPGLTQALPNPFSGDTLGNYHFYASPGKYIIQVSGTNVSGTTTYTDVTLPNDPNNPAFTLINLTNQSSKPTPPPPTGTVYFYSKTDNNLYVENSAGVEVQVGVGGGGGGTPAGSNGAVQCNNVGAFGACNASDLAGNFTINDALIAAASFTANSTATVTGALTASSSATITGNFIAKSDSQFGGLNPWVDIRSKGARAVSSVPSTTANCTSGQNTVTLATASGFQTGDGIRIDGCGPTNTMSTPGAPTVAPSISHGLIGTDELVAAPSGSTTYPYQIAARDKLGALTAASAVGSTTTGLSALGDSGAVSLSSCTRSNTTVTCNTSSSTNIVVNAAIWIQGFTDGTFNGAWLVATAPTSSQFTFTSAWDTRNGASATATGSGTVDYYSANHISWSAVTGAWQYYVYLNGTLIGVSKPGELFYDDWGATMRGTTSFPSYIPTSAPAAATNDPLVTTIVSGGGTTSLTLANTASNSASAARTVFDNAPAILATETASNPNPIYIPNTASGTAFVVNSYLDLSPYTNATIIQSGTLTLNETMALPSQHSYFGDRSGSGKQSSSFAWGGEALINVGPAYPGILGVTNQSRNEGLTLSSGSDQALLWLDSEGSGANETFNHVIWVTGNTGNNEDYLGIAYENKGSFQIAFEYNTFNPQMNQTGPTGLWAPHLYDRGSISNPANTAGNLILKNNTGSSKGVGFDITGITSNPENIVDYWYAQGPRMPIWTFSCPVGGACNIGQNIALKNVNVDTSFIPILANLGQNNVAVYAENNQQGSNFQFYTGVPVSAFINGSAGGAYPNTGITGPIAGYSSDRNVNVNGVGAFTYDFSVLPTAPTISANAGGSFPTGAHSFVVKFVDINGNVGSSSLATNFTVSSGNQAIQISLVSPPQGVVTWYPIVDGNNSAPPHDANQCGLLGPTATWNANAGAFGCVVTATSFAGPSSVSSKGVNTPTLNLINQGFTATADFPTLLTANRNWHVPNQSGTLTFFDAPQTWTSDQSFNANLTFSNSKQVRFLSTNGTNYAGFQGGASTSNLVWLLPSADSTGTQCLASNGSLQFSFTPCSAGTGTPGGANTQVQFNNSATFGGSTNLTWVSPALTIGTPATATGQLILMNGGASGVGVTLQNNAATTAYNFNLPSISGTLGQPLLSGGGGSTAMTFGTLGYGGGGTGQTTFTNNSLVSAGTTSLSSLAGTTTGTNPVLTLTAGSASAVPLALNTAASPTGDIFDLQINGAKTSWFDSAAFLHAPQVTFSGTGALSLSGTEATCSGSLSGTDLLCIGDSSTHTIQSSLNGGGFKPVPQWINANPQAHGVLIVGSVFPQINFTTAGVSGQALLSGGISADPAYGNLGVGAGGSGDTTLTAHSVLLGEGTSPIAFSGPSATSGFTLQSQGSSADPIFAALNLAGAGVTGILPVANGGTGSGTLAGANIVTVTGAITANDCVKWSSSTVITDFGSACGGGGGSPALSAITAATIANSINNGANTQTWNFTFSGSGTGMKFSENTASTGSGNILLYSTTPASSTSSPFQADNNGNGWQVNSSGSFRPVGTGTFATGQAAHTLVVSQGTAAISSPGAGNAGQVLISNGASADPSFQDPIVSQAFTNLFNAISATGTQTSSNVRNPIFSQTGTLSITWASITGSPSACTLQIKGVDSLGNSVNDGSTISVTPSNGTTTQTFTAAAGILTAAQVAAVYACTTYPSTGTLSLDFSPMSTVYVQNTVSTNPPSNASTNVAQFGGNAVVTGTGASGSGIPRVTISNDSSLAANQSTNVNQFGGSAVVTGTGASGSGIPRVTISNDSSLAANQSVNVNQIGGSAVSTAATGVQKVGVTGNAGAAMDAAGQNASSPANEMLTGCQFNTTPTTITSGNISPKQCDSSGNLLVNLKTALPTGANVIGALTANQSVNLNQIGGTALAAADPCQANARSSANINETAGSRIVTGVASKQTYICSMEIITATAQNVALVEGTGTTCATSTAGMAGGSTAATGWNFGANGGFVKGVGSNWVFKTATAADDVCLLQSGSGQISGSVQYVQQ